MRAPLLLLAGLSTLGALLWVNRDAVRGIARRSLQVRQELQRWEGEGGNPVVPATASPAARGPGDGTDARAPGALH